MAIENSDNEGKLNQPAAPGDAGESLSPATDSESQMLDQAALDALLAGNIVEPQPQQDHAPEPDGVLDQAMLDALLAGNNVRPQPQQDHAPEPDGVLDQAMLDALLAAQAGEPDGNETSPPERDQEQSLVLDQAMLDALLAEEAGEQNEIDEDLDKNLLNEHELDALIAEHVGPAPEQPVINTDSSQYFDEKSLRTLLEDDTVLGSAGNMPDPPPQGDVESMLAARQADTGASARPVEAAALDQAGIDALLAAGEDTEAAALDQDAIDAIMGGSADEDGGAGGQGGGGGIDAITAGSADTDGPALDQDAIDAILAGGAPQEAQPDGADSQLRPATEQQQGEPSDSESALGLSQDMINSLIAAAQSGADIESAAPEPVLPLAKSEPEQPAVEGLLTQEDLDVLIEQALEEQKQRQANPRVWPDPEEPEDEKEPRRKLFGKPSLPKCPAAVAEFCRHTLLKTLVTVAVATMAGTACYTYLYVNQERVPTPEILEDLAASSLSAALDDAVRLIDQSLYTQAREMLEKALAASDPDQTVATERSEAEYLILKSTYLQFAQKPEASIIAPVMDKLNAYLDAHAHDAHEVDARYWKATLLSMQDVPKATAAEYAKVIEQAGNHPELERMLFAAARAAVDAEQPAHAVVYLERMLRDFPDAPDAREAKLLLGDAYAAAGRPGDAASTFSTLASSLPPSCTSAEAAARLARLQVDQGRPEEAIAALEQRLASATSVEGNDRVYLALARAYRAAGKNAEARSALNDILNFFPESEVTPAVHLELCQVLDDLAQTDQALQNARQAARRYPDDVDLVMQLARLLEKKRLLEEAGKMRMAAYEKGKKDPEILLTAARNFRNGGTLKSAETQYRTLVREYPRFPQALEGNIELCETIFDQGRVSEAVDRLEDLALTSPDGPRQLPILLALGRMYEKLEVPGRTGAIFKKIAAKSSEPAVLGQAAINLMKCGQWNDGIAVAGRVDAAQLDAQTASALLTKLGEGLMMTDATRSQQCLEKAYTLYPDQRTSELEVMLVKSYMDAGNTAGAQGIVAELEGLVQQDKKKAPRLAAAAVQLADAAFARADYAAAADAYAKVAQLPEPAPEAAWAKYQHANALMRLARFEETAKAYDDLASANTPFSGDAKIKADAARLKQRLSRFSGANELLDPQDALTPLAAQPQKGDAGEPPSVG